LEACALLAEFYSDESVRQQLFNKRLEQYLGKPIYSVKLTSGVSATDGSIVDKPEKPEVTAPCCKPNMMSSHHVAQVSFQYRVVFAHVTCIYSALVHMVKLMAITCASCPAAIELFNISSSFWQSGHTDNKLNCAAVCFAAH